MPTIYARWILGICLRFGNNLAKMCSFAESKRPKLDICTNLQKKQCIGDPIFFSGNGASKYCPPYTRDGFWVIASDLEIIYPKCVHLWNLTDQNLAFAPIYRKSTALESNYFWGMELLNNSHHISKMDFRHLPQICK